MNAAQLGGGANVVAPRLGYRPSIDGLRALAVLGVLLAHLDLPPWTGTRQGFVGVYIFFAISGFLITTLLLEERERYGSVSLPLFWGRRAVRLLPALFALVAVTLVLAGIAGNLHEYLTVSLPVLFYFGNWVAALGNEADLGVWFHTWSLAVEEQFYLAWPLLLIGAYAIAKSRGVLWTALLLAAGSVVARCLLYEESPIRGIRGTDTMADLLLYGCMLAAVLHGRGRLAAWMRGRVSRWSGPVGLALVLAVMIIPMKSEPLHLLGAPVVAVGTCLLILHFTHSSGWIVTAFSWRPVVMIGLWSYSLYIWHTIPYLFFRHRTGNEWVDAVASLCSSFVLAVASYYLIERPFRNRFHARLSRSARAAGAGSRAIGRSG